VHAARMWEAIIARPDAEGVTAEHRASAMTCLSRVLRSRAARKVALDVAARVAAEDRLTRARSLSAQTTANAGLSTTRRRRSRVTPTWRGRPRTPGRPVPQLGALGRRPAPGR
jgi:hypothetical protein